MWLSIFLSFYFFGSWPTVVKDNPSCYVYLVQSLTFFLFFFWLGVFSAFRYLWDDGIWLIQFDFCRDWNFPALVLWNWGWGSDHAWVWTCSEAFIWVQMGCWDNGIMCKTSDGWWAVCVCMLIKSYTPPLFFSYGAYNMGGKNLSALFPLAKKQVSEAHTTNVWTYPKPTPNPKCHRHTVFYFFCVFWPSWNPNQSSHCMGEQFLHTFSMLSTYYYSTLIFGDQFQRVHQAFLPLPKFPTPVPDFLFFTKKKQKKPLTKK